MSLAVNPYQTPIIREESVPAFFQSFDQSASKLRTQFTFTQTLDVMFPEQKRQNKEIARVRADLGELAHEFTDAQLQEMVTDIDYLVTSWLDDFERSIFDGQTLQELLHEKGGIL